MPRFWLMKSEPETWSWDQQVAQGDEGESWDGVRNYQAAKSMKEMAISDLVFFYHSGKTREIVGICEVIKPYHSDSTDETGRFGMVTIKALKKLSNPVTLKDIKASPELSNLGLVKQSRLSVMSIDEEAWFIIIGMSAND